MKQKYIITIGRQLGSGGHEIGERLGQELSIPVYDKEIIKQAALNSGICEDVLEQFDEKPTNSLLYSLVMNTTYADKNSAPLETRAYSSQVQIIREAAQKGPCVIIGRSADYILKDMENVVRIFVLADRDIRISRTMERKQISQKQAQELIKKVDKSRASFYNFHTEQTWGNATNYDLSINSGRIGIEQSVKVILAYINSLN